MSRVELLDQAKHRLEALSLQRLQVAADFLAYLAERESNKATAELLAIPGFLDDLRQAEEAIAAAGKLTPVEELRRAS
jgi:hypothetical protein